MYGIPKLLPFHHHKNITFFIRKCWTLKDFSRLDVMVTGSKINRFNVTASSISVMHQSSLYNSSLWNKNSSTKLFQSRNYAKKRKSREQSPDEESDSEDESDEFLDKYDKGSKVMKTNVSSLRLDVLIKAGLGFSRNKIDEMFYEGRMRINGAKVLKKSQRLAVGDEVDVIKEISSNNEKLINVSRIEILSAVGDEEEETITVKLRRMKQLSIENYVNHPWKEVTE